MMLRHYAALFALAAWVAAAGAAEEIVTLESRPGVTQAYLLTRSDDAAHRLVAILFPGGAGNVNLQPRADGTLVGSNNFLVRTRALFVDAGIATAVIDAPSDMRSMSDAFRAGDAHAADVGAVARDLRQRFPQAKLFLVGTSRGTVSAAHTALALGGDIDGVVLTSTVFNASRSAAGLTGFGYARIKSPLLFVHHRDDACSVCPYSGAAALAGRYPLVSVSGGLPPESGPCEPLSAHGYFGRERDTVGAIAQWMAGRPHSTNIR
jgi:pimeloyl-ACP methyl ester carboxylesterase